MTWPLIVAAFIVFYLFNSIKILREYERGVIFRLGRVFSKPKGPGLIFVFAPIDRIVRVSLRIIVMDIPSQDVITRDKTGFGIPVNTWLVPGAVDVGAHPTRSWARRVAAAFAEDVQ